VAIFNTLIYGGPLRSGYRPGEITFSLSALGPNLRYMPAHLIQAMPMLVLGLAALAGIAVRWLRSRGVGGQQAAAARRDLAVAVALAACWAAIWVLYATYVDRGGTAPRKTHDMATPQFSVTRYAPNHRIPLPAMPGHAGRGGSPSRLASNTAPSTRTPIRSRPRASAPGPKRRAELRIETKADAHSTTVTAAAATARPSTRLAVPARSAPGLTPNRSLTAPARRQIASRYGQVGWSDAEVITQGRTAFVGDTQRPPAADRDDPREGKEMPVQGRTDRTSQVQPAFGEVKARQHQRPAAGPGGSQIDADLSQPGSAVVGQNETRILPQQAPVRHRLGDRDAKAAGEMVVTGAGAGQCPVRRALRQGAGRCRLDGSVRDELLDQVRRPVVGEPEVAMPPLPHLDQKTALDEPVEMLRRGGTGYLGGTGEFAGGPGTPVQQGNAERRAGLIREKRSQCSEAGGLRVGHATIIHAG